MERPRAMDSRAGPGVSLRGERFPTCASSRALTRGYAEAAAAFSFRLRRPVAPASPLGARSFFSDFLSLSVGASARSTSRSEEHTSELQSLRHLVCRLLPDKKNKHP